MAYDRILAREGFDGADTDDITARTADGGDTPAAAVGVWARHPESSTLSRHAIRDNEGASLFTFVESHLEEVPGLVPDHAAEAVVRFLSLDTGEPGVVEPPCGNINFPANDGENPDFTPQGGFDEAVGLWYRRTGSGPAEVTFEYATGNGSTAKYWVEFDGAGHVRIYRQRFIPLDPPFPDESEPKALISGVLNEPGQTNCYYFLFRNEDTTYIHEITGDPMPATSHGISAGLPGNTANAIFWTSHGGGARTSFASSFTGDVEAFAHFPPTFESPIGGDGFELAYAEVVVRADPVAATNYSFGAQFEHFDGDFPTLYFWLMRRRRASTRCSARARRSLDSREQSHAQARSDGRGAHPARVCDDRRGERADADLRVQRRDRSADDTGDSSRRTRRVTVE